MIGKCLGPYEILSKLGAGGMGEVYRARDTHLDRDVAIKVLPDALADDAERLERFEREAKTLASLNHPNIAQVYGLETLEGSGSARAIVMELVDGQTLDAAIPEGGLPLDDALPIARQIADALEAAHEQGIVHRDLKPANIMLTPDGHAGRIKVLDFGLAQATDPPAASGDILESPTLTARATQMGVILGTAAYMAPEQARGLPVDKRADIWAFGVVLHEMLTGERLFAGDDVSETLASVLKDEPDLSAAPREVRRLLDACLQKNPRDRLRDIGDAWTLLDRPDEPPTPGTAPGPIGRPGGWIAAVGFAVLVAAVLVAALGGWWVGRQDSGPVEAWSQFTQLTDQAGAETGPALSPDGNSFAYVSRATGSWDIYVQRVGGRNAIAVAADPERDEAWPTFSPDGSLIAYNEADADGGIWVVGATGESNRRVTDFGFNPTWSPDGAHIAFATSSVGSPYQRGQNSTLWRVALAGGAPIRLGEQDAVQPAWSPSGARIAVWFQEGGQRDLATMPAEGGESLVLLDDAPLDWSPTWSPDGRYLYFSSDRGGTLGLWRLPIDEATGRARGEPEPVANGLEASMSLPRVSTDGRRLLFRSETWSLNPVVIPFDPDTERAGTPRELLRRIGILRPTSVSPDGQWLALCNRGEPREDLFLLRTDGTALRRLTDDVARDRTPSFSPDGTRVSFHSNRGGAYAGYSLRVDGSGLTQLTDASLGDAADLVFEPGGDRIVFNVLGGGVFLAGPPWPTSARTAEPLAEPALPDAEWEQLSTFSWSPDGRRLAGSSRTEYGISIGVYDVASGERRLFGAGVRSSVRWLPDSRRLIYFSEENESQNMGLAVLDVETGEQRFIAVDLPLPLADDDFALAPDGTAIYYGGERIESNIWMVEQAR